MFNFWGKFEIGRSQIGRWARIISRCFGTFQMTINLIAREIVIDGDDCVEHTASPFFCRIPPHAIYFQSPGIMLMQCKNVLL